MRNARVDERWNGRHGTGRSAEMEQANLPSRALEQTCFRFGRKASFGAGRFANVVTHKPATASHGRGVSECLVDASHAGFEAGEDLMLPLLGDESVQVYLMMDHQAWLCCLEVTAFRHCDCGEIFHHLDEATRATGSTELERVSYGRKGFTSG